MKFNKIERLKIELKPYDFLDKLDSLDLDNLSENDRFYLKNFGIYNHKLSPEKFMLRVRIVAGRIDIDSLKYISQIAKRYDLSITITMRAQLELHRLDSSNVIYIYNLLRDRGITTWQTLSDNIRNIVTDPLDGVAVSNSFEVYPIIEEMEHLIISNPKYFGVLPRKFNTAISATIKNQHSLFGSDLYFALASKDQRVGFNIYLGGKNSAMAKSANIFIEPIDVIEIFDSILKAYMKYGLRSTRSKTRLYHLLQDIGIDRFRSHIDEFCDFELEEEGDISIEKIEIDSFTELKDTKYAYKFESRYGEIDTAQLDEICRYATKNNLSIRLGIDKNIYILGLTDMNIPFIKRDKTANISLCTGSRYCSLSLFDMREEVSQLPIYRVERLGIHIGFSGCLKGCGRHHHTDIGLVGLRTAIYGKTQKSLRLYLGGEYTKGIRVSRLIFMAIPLHAISSIIDTILDEFEDSIYSDFEDFGRYILNNHSTEFLALWFLAKLYYRSNNRLIPLTNLSTIENEIKLIQNSFGEIELPIDRDKTIFYKSIQILSQKLWSDTIIFS